MLKIELTHGHISSLAPHIEQQGDECAQTVDITIVCDVAGRSKSILAALHIGDLFDALWDDDGLPQCPDADIRMRQKLSNCDVTLTDMTGRHSTCLNHADLKGFRIQPMPDVALGLQFKVHARIDGAILGKLWDLQMDDRIKFSVEERQGSLDIAA